MAKLKGLIGKNVVVDPLQAAVENSATALDVFYKAGADLDVANDALRGVVAEEEGKIASAQQRVGQAKSQTKSNEVIKAKIDSLLTD